MLDGLSDLAGIYVLQHKLICETNCGHIDDTPMEGVCCACGMCTPASGTE